MLKPRESDGPPDAAQAWRRVRGALHRLFEALADLDEAGGLDAAANVHGWSPRRRMKALALLGLVRRMIDHEDRRTRDAWR